ncbi:3-hydroxydecanoyl-[ACP] dehydratase [hydrothermal vent metagenome]|uniref:3-hydroxydecanoyl-[ACP] dehydratase n=1 Tax=hydrothermal vent metagenome TaxID=652676 RepID=A0A3B1BGE8_9ZZZZ
MRINKARLSELIPHAGNMVLIDSVETWDNNEIVCKASSHTDPENPLRDGNQLGSICIIEYAAQAMAVHGALVAGAQEKPEEGYLGGLKDITLFVGRLDNLESNLEIYANRKIAINDSFVYDFSVSYGEAPVAEGRLFVFTKPPV